VNDVYLMCEARGHDDQAVAANLNHLAATFITLVSRQRSGQYEKSLAGLRAQEHALRTEITSLQNRLATLQVSGNQSLTSQYQSTALQSQITQDQGSLSQLTVQESQAQQSLDQVKSAVHVVNPAVPSPTDLGPSAGKNALLGVVVGILFAIGLVVLFEYLDDTFRSIDEVGEVTKLSVLGAVQPYKQAGGSPFHAWQELHSGVAEAYRVIRTNIQFTSIDKSPGVITITSARDGEGKSTTAVNLAIAMALSQQRVLLVDADLRRQGLTSRFGYQQVSGLSDALINPGIDVGVTVEEVPNLTVVPAGPIPPNPAELLGSDRMTEWLEKQRNMYDVVILDSPPVLSVADGRILSAVSDAVVMLADPTISSRRLVKQARFALATVGTPIIGVVINKARFYSQESYYTYFYYDDKRETPHPLPVAGDPIASSPDRIQVS
jgi:non-specific protein-tyrosine kinase